MKNKNTKLGHQAIKGYVHNKFNSIGIDGDLRYCKSHNFMYDGEIEEEKLYNGQPCYYTDSRFIDGRFNFYKNSMIYWTRWKEISLKSCLRRIKKVKGIPVGTIVDFNKSWYIPKKNVDISYRFKVTKYNPVDVNYEINSPRYSEKFVNCDFSNKLTDELRKNGFIVGVSRNESFLGNMLNTAISYAGGEFKDSEIEGDIAIAYGYGKKIGFSSFKNDFMGYSDGYENILWDKFGEFDKWSRCNLISKNTPIEDIVEILMRPNNYE